MKYIIISILIVVLIFVLFIQFWKKNENTIFRQQTNSFETENNQQKLKKSIPETLKKINKKEYHRFIFTNNTTERYIIKGIKQYGKVSGNEEYKIYNFGIAQHGDWKIIMIEEPINFYVYHNLVGWLSGYEESQDIPQLVIGFAKHKTDSQENYLFFLDPKNENGDTQIGAFKNGKAFDIYLPEAYEEYGNLIINKEVKIPIKEYLGFIFKKGFDVDKLLSLNYTVHKIRMNE